MSKYTHCNGSIRTPYLIIFSKNNLDPPRNKRRKPQLTNPSKLLNPEDHENKESANRWILQRENATNKIHARIQCSNSWEQREQRLTKAYGLSGLFLLLCSPFCLTSSTVVVDLAFRSLIEFPFSKTKEFNDDISDPPSDILVKHLNKWLKKA